MKGKEILYFKFACMVCRNFKAPVRSFGNYGPGLFMFVVLAILAGCSNNPTTVDPEPIEQVKYIDNEAAWSPDGIEIAYYHAGVDSGGIYIINTDGTNRMPFLLNSSSDKSWGLPDWSPDGNWLLLNDLNSAQIYKIKYPSGDSLTQLTFSGSNFFPSWSPVGNMITFSQSIHDPYAPESTGIWLANDDGANLRHIGLGYMPDWFPNGDKLVYSGGPGTTTAEYQIWKADTTGQNQNQLTSLYVSNRYPKVSPNGSQIAFSSHADGQGFRVWVVNSDGSNPIKLTETGGTHPAWSPDGTKIVYCNTVDGHLWTMNSDGSNKKQLTF